MKGRWAQSWRRVGGALTSGAGSFCCSSVNSLMAFLGTLSGWHLTSECRSDPLLPRLCSGSAHTHGDLTAAEVAGGFCEGFSG